jgi:hypothetical protein
MEIILEFLFSFFGELLLQLFAEVLADLGVRFVSGWADAAKQNPVAAFLGYLVMGAVAGGLSLLLFREHMLKATWLRVVLLVVIPLVAGWLMSFIGARREAKGASRTRLESFANGYAFALAMGVVRFLFAK